MEKILKHYFKNIDQVSINPINSGWINSTYEVEYERKKFILQKINTHVFPKPEVISNNIDIISNHLKAKNYKDAISEGEQAIAINPYLSNCNAILAKAYFTMWLTDNLAETRERATYYAKKELVVDPRDQQAIMILSAINKKTEVLEKDDKS